MLHNESCDFKFKTDIEVPKAVELRVNSLAEQNILLVTETPNETQAASHMRYISEPDMQVGKPTLVYRGISKKRQRSLQSIEPRVPEGRPRTNGFALDME
ncbi:hypothetical protein PHMEG_00033901 [Phytophthora megakarya]|uniref:Uncharacterized protein n=1 Tax=Phytophthora megakarya TaxID=4795 RepID=A0A225USG8_9STRA|nr:hypothetical protein PHMEG_00033901 [Phytophthora megakarya]